MAASAEKSDGITYHPEIAAVSTDLSPAEPKAPSADGAIPSVSTEEAVAASVDSTKSQIHPTFTASKQLKEEEKKEEEAKKENGVQKLKSSLLVTGVVVAVIGAIFAVVKNIKKA